MQKPRRQGSLDALTNSRLLIYPNWPRLTHMSKLMEEKSPMYMKSYSYLFSLILTLYFLIWQETYQDTVIQV
jgi:hypothetical protein